VAALAAELRRSRFDVLVSHTSPELTWLATRIARTPYVQYHNSPPYYIGSHRNPYMASNRYRKAFASLRSTVVGYDALAEMPPAPLLRARAELRSGLKHRALRDARAVIVPSRRSAAELRILHGVDATVLRGCVPAGRIRGQRETPLSIAPPGRRVVLSVCRLDEVKRIDLLIEAFARARSGAPDAYLVIAGTGPEERRLRALAATAGVAQHVGFAGYIADDDLWRCYAAASVLAAPAMADFIIAPYEALAAGCRVVWTTEMETDPAIEASGRVFVAAPEVDAFAAGIVAALDAPDAPAPDLSALTWDARGARLEAIVQQATGLAAFAGVDRHEVAA
jgi:glycosyltransferase involved in cell wall biosynthesis